MYQDRNKVVLPLEIEKIIQQNDPVFKLVEIYEKLDYNRLEKEYVRSWRKPNSATMFIILVYAYRETVFVKAYKRSVQNGYPTLCLMSVFGKYTKGGLCFPIVLVFRKKPNTILQIP